MPYLKLPILAITFFCSFMVLLMPSHGNAQTTANQAEITLSEEEVKFVRWLVATDEMVKGLTKQGELLHWLNRLIGVVPGPVKIVQQWNMSAIALWRTANKNLVMLKKQAHCHRIQEVLAGGTENSEFFEKLSEARGCEKQ